MTAMGDWSERTKREAEGQPDTTIGYHAFLSHSNNSYWQGYRNRVFRKALARASSILEIGCTAWAPYIEGLGLRPKRIECINIFEPHLQVGIELAKSTLNKPQFQVMDAHELKFADNSFDVVFGCHILHHLHTARAINEFHRVLRPGGFILFDEPLGGNPVANFVRWLTPDSHTPDEEPLSSKHFKIIRERFRLAVHAEELFTVPAAVLSKLFYATGTNMLMKSVYSLDLALLRVVPGLWPIFRYVVIEGQRR